MLTTRVVAGTGSASQLRDVWEAALAARRAGVFGPDVTCSPTWAQALLATHLEQANVRTLVVADGSRDIAVVPTYVTRAAPRTLHLLTESYAGRAGLLIPPDEAVARCVVRGLIDDLRGWDVFHFSEISGSAHHSIIADAARHEAVALRVLSEAQSPYIELAASWDAMLAALPKKMRWTIRKGEKDLAERGRIEYRCVQRLEDVPQLLADVYAIEKRSWKEASGSSITSQSAQTAFYEHMISGAAAAGILSAHVLRTGDTPVAYILGLDGGDGVFLDLKESFDTNYSEQSPGHVLKRYTFATLIAAGVRLYDFMGACEPYKMRWTNLTYTRASLALYNTSLRGRLRYWRTLAQRLITPADRESSAARI